MIDINDLPMVEETEAWDSVLLIPDNTSELNDSRSNRLFHVIGCIDDTPDSYLGSHYNIHIKSKRHTIIRAVEDNVFRIRFADGSKMLVDTIFPSCVIR